MESAVLGTIPAEYITYEKLADRIGEVPWDVLKACYALTRQKKIERHPDRRRGEFRKKSG